MSRLADTPLAVLAPLAELLDPAYPAEWRDIATGLFVQMRESRDLVHLAQPQLAQLALRLTEGLRAEFGGSQQYLSKGERYNQQVRDRAIYAEANGRNIDELAHKYGLTPRQVYNIIATQSDARQGKLPFMVPPDDENTDEDDD
jgi:hypothetical protein